VKRNSILFCLALLPLAAGETGSREQKFGEKGVKSIAIKGLAERFHLKVEEGREDVVVHCQGAEAELDGVAVHLSGRKLCLRGKPGEQPAVTVVAPPGLDVKVRHCRGGQIGDTGARLDLHDAGPGGYLVGEVRGSGSSKPTST
jgi:hypothetical protein